MYVESADMSSFWMINPNMNSITTSVASTLLTNQTALQRLGYPVQNVEDDV
jgi:hypothetical protein